jgi:hypothetical protein
MDKKTITDHFRRNIFEAYSHYNVWKMIAYSKSSGVVNIKMAERYVKVQGYHNAFFAISERASLIAFIMLILHPFDKDERSLSLYKVDKRKTEDFISENTSILDELFLVRNKVFAHSDMDAESSTIKNYVVPSVERLDTFFKKLTEFYNELCRDTDQSFTIFDNAEDLKHDVERLFMNLYRGENVRLNEIEVEWDWQKSNKKISDII